MAQKSEKYLRKIRNVGIIAHIDAGKTTLTERVLFYTKKIHRMGEVHDGSATMDYMPEEQEHGITIVSACTSCHWKDFEINIIDTPGHVDFTIEVERALRVLDGAVGVFCAVGGVEPQSETVWKQSEMYKVPKLAFVNKMDRLGADFERVLKDMKTKLKVTPLPLQVPIGEGEEFQGVIDVLRNEALQFDVGSFGADYTTLPLSEEQKEVAGKWREQLLETLAETNEDILTAYLEGKEISPAELKKAVREATLRQTVVPVFAGSALKNIGVQPLMDAIGEYLPSPLEVPPQQGVDAKTKKKLTLEPKPSAPFAALVFKVTMETGRKLILMRIYSGSIKAGQTVYNVTQDQEERAARLFLLHAGQKEKLDEAIAGQIVAVAGMKYSKTGDTLTSKDHPLILEQISKYRPVISLALEPKSTAEEEKLEEALQKMLQEDPTLFMDRDKDTEQLILSGMGELHLEIVLERLKREYNVGLRAGNPQVVYQETILSSGAGQAEFHKELGETLHKGYVELHVERRERSSGNKILFAMDTEGWSDDLLSAVEQGVEDALQGGVIKGFPLQDIKVSIQEIRKESETSVIGLHAAAMTALRKAIGTADPALMEPLMWVEVFVPEEFVGDVVSLLGSKGAKIENMFDRHGQKIVQALTPLRQLFGFSTALRSATQGRAGLVMRFDRFDVLE